jgi:hypothetical protein
MLTVGLVVAIVLTGVGVLIMREAFSHVSL